MLLASPTKGRIDIVTSWSYSRPFATNALPDQVENVPRIHGRSGCGSLQTTSHRIGSGRGILIGTFQKRVLKQHSACFCSLHHAYQMESSLVSIGTWLHSRLLPPPASKWRVAVSRWCRRSCAGLVFRVVYSCCPEKEYIM